MARTTNIWELAGTRTAYPGLTQIGDSCVLASIAGALNYLAGTLLTAEEMVERWQRDGMPQPNFDLVLEYLKPELSTHPITITRYHDQLAPLPSPTVLFEALGNGAVVVPSFQACTLEGEHFVRRRRWHMLSLFNLQDNQCQVWDTNMHPNRETFFRRDDLLNLFAGEFPPIPYFPDETGRRQFLTSHDQHEVLVLSRSPN